MSPSSDNTDRTASAAGDHHHLSAIDLALDDFAELLGVVADDADAVHFRAGIPSGRRQCVRVDVVDLPVARGARDVDQLATDGHDRQPRTRVHQHPFPPDRSQQPHLGSPDDRSGAHGHITGLDIVPGTPHVSTRGGPAQDPHLRRPAVGPPQWQDRVGQRG